jgi:hypothetical protein
MKNKFAQLYLFVSQVDHRYLQLAYFAFILAVSFGVRSPVDGGGGTR